VKGHIEQGAPPLVVLTRSLPVNSNNKTFQEQRFVHNAQVVVTTGGRSYVLKELATPAFTPQLRQLITAQFGVPAPKLTSGSDFIFYVYTTEELKGEVGKSYGLRISHEGRVLTATTTIPHLNPLDSLWTVPHPNPAQDSLVTLYYRYSDPDTLGNSIRYFTKRNREPFYPGHLTSVFNDELINGAPYIDFPLERGRAKNEKETVLSSFFSKGDTVTVRWCAIDLAHYRFWLSAENEQNSNGSPIGSPNTTRSNINGGLGIWGGYGVTYHSLIIK